MTLCLSSQQLHNIALSGDKPFPNCNEDNPHRRHLILEDAHAQVYERDVQAKEATVEADEARSSLFSITPNQLDSNELPTDHPSLQKRYSRLGDYRVAEKDSQNGHGSWKNQNTAALSSYTSPSLLVTGEIRRTRSEAHQLRNKAHQLRNKAHQLRNEAQRMKTALAEVDLLVQKPCRAA